MSSEGSSLEFLQKKWRAWFKSLDVNKDGKVSRQDYTNSEEEFENYYKSRVDEKDLEIMREGFRLFWEEFIFRRIAHKDSITEDEFIVSITKEYQSDPEALGKMARRIFGQLTRCADVDHNGFLSYDEFAVLYKSFGHKDESVLRAMYEDYSPMEKGIGVMEFTESWIDVAVGIDPDKVNLPYKGFLSHLRELVSS